METSVNNKCKAFTSLEQSKKLTEILPLESADMIYIMYSNGEKPQNGDANLSTVYESSEHQWYWIDIIDEAWNMRIGEDIPCWSLTALLGVLPNGNMLVKTTDGEYYYLAKDIMTKHYDNPIDACYEMILKLHELKMLQL